MVGWNGVKDISGARVRDLVWHADSRGALTELFRESWEGGRGVPSRPDGYDPAMDLGCARQVYLSETEPGLVKGFHVHRVQWDRFVCLRGRVLVVLADAREGSPTRFNVWETVLDPDRAHRCLVIPPGVLHGWMALPGSGRSAVLNCVSREYSPPGTPACDEFRQGAHEPLWPGGDAYDWHRRRDE